MIEWEGERYLTAEEAHTEYGRSQGSLYYHLAQKRIGMYTFEGDHKSYWKASELEALKDARRSEKPATPHGPPMLSTPKPKKDARETNDLALAHV